jgi:hypothetical protein
LATSLGLYATENKNTALSKQLQPVILSEVQGTVWVQKCVEQYPEILWLADVKVRKTEEGLATMQGPYSEQLFGQKFIEFDRTIMTLHCLRLILDGSENAYQKFTAAQPGDAKLSRTSFENLHSQGVALVGSNFNGMSELEMTQAMEAALVLGDIGKSEQARAVFKPYGAVAPDHDDFHGEVMQILERHPNLCPTFDKLTPSADLYQGVKAVIFDCDGILVDTEYLKFLAWQEALASQDIEFSIEEYMPLVGYILLPAQRIFFKGFSSRRR